jgi:methionyl-tRNA synthetase
MEVRTCRSCGRLFNYITGPSRCPACSDALEKKFQEVKSYIWEHKTATLQEISEENDVSPNQLRQWVREERLTFSDDSPVGLECENCGATIKTGRFCQECKNKLGNSLNSVIPKHQEEAPKKVEGDHKNKMRYLQ